MIYPKKEQYTLANLKMEKNVVEELKYGQMDQYMKGILFRFIFRTWQDNERTGYGRFINKDGDVFQGTWKNSKLTGYGE